MILALILLAQGIAGYGSIQLPPPPQQVTAGHRDFVSVKDFGAKGDGVTDDSTAIQAAITAAQSTGARLYFPVGTYVVSTLAVTSSVQIYGEGTLKQKATTTGDMLTISGTSTVVRIDGLTLDGNEQNQVFETANREINFTAIGTASLPAGLEVQGCLFLNGARSDIRVSTDGTLATSEWVRIIGNTFLGGREGTSAAYDPRYIDLPSPTNYVVENNVFDRLAAPVTFGRAGIVAYDGAVTGVEGTGSITGNKFNFVGRSQATTTLGSIDLYSRAHSVSISGNSLTNPYGRGINVKAESKAVAIVGNTVDGLSGGSDATISSQIVLNASVVTAANGPFTISSNSLLGSGNDGISVTATDSGGTLFPHAVMVNGNTIKDAVRRSIGVVGGGAEVSVTDNNIFGSQVGLFADALTAALHVTGNLVKGTSSSAYQVSAANTGTYLTFNGNTGIGGTRCILIASGAGGSIGGNVCTGQSTSGIDISGTTAALMVSRNFSDDAVPFVNSGTNTALHVTGNDWTMSGTAHTLTIATGAVTATMDWHFIDGAATDTLTTINGGYDGQVLTLRPLTTLHVITVQNGTLRLARDFVMDDPKDSITLRYDGSTWVEVSHSNNGGALSSGTITLVAGSGTATVTSGARCLCTDATANASVRCAVGTTTLTATGTGTDVIVYQCF